MPDSEEAPSEYVEHFKKQGLTLGKRLGSGASGNVYRAVQTRLGRELAIKFFDHPNKKADQISKKRFEREARLLAKVQHPSIPFVLSCGTIPGPGDQTTPYTIMQLIDGIGLNEVITKGKIKLQTAVSHMKHIISALSCAHQNNIIHRDVKPENIIISTTGHCYLIDFSIGVSLAIAPGLTRVTGDSRTPGTWVYAAPEQIAGGEVDGRADLFSAGLVFFELLSGRRIIKPDISESELSQLPLAARDLLRRACQADPKKRFQNARDFHNELERLEVTRIERDEPKDALCLNAQCPNTRWDKNGWYQSPNVVQDTTKSFCKDCGNTLKYPCEKCGAPFNNNQYCADCGNRHFTRPGCEKCGILLNKKDRYKNTAKEGCSSCLDDDDIPF